MQTGTITQTGVLRWARSEDWLTLLLAGAGILVVVRSVEVAEWVATPSLMLTAVLGVLVGLLVIRIPWKAWQGHLIASSVGAMAVYLQGTGLADAGSLGARTAELNSRLAAWWTALVSNEISTDPLPFALILSSLAWTGGYLSSWAIFKRGNVWLAILPSGVALLVNLTYLPERFFVYLFPYLLATMMLMIRLNSVERQSHFKRQGIGYPSSLRVLWLVSGLVFSSIIVGVVFLLPPNNARHAGLVRVWNASRQPVDSFQQEFGRMFSAVGSKHTLSARRFGATLLILPTTPASNEPVFVGEIPFAVYWKVRAYTTYTSGGWTTDNTVLEAVPPLDPLTVDDLEGDLDQGETTYRVEVAFPTSYLYVPSPLNNGMSLPVQVESHKSAPLFSDMVTLRPEKRLAAGDEYIGTFLGSIQPERFLRTAGQDYPQWVTEQYLELPTSLPQRVVDQAIELTMDATNPYDKARAIEEYLRTFSYGVPTSVPEFDDDRVDHFLFGSKTGHSDHFASTMAVMLRAVGIPARLVAGYGPGVPDPEQSYFTISEGDQHSWTEAYFSGFGWIEFEPSPIYPLRPRALSDLMGFAAALAAALSGESLANETTQEEVELGEGEIDTGGGRLRGGEGIPPIPLIDLASPLGMGGAVLVAFLALWTAGLWLVWHRFFMALPRPELAYARMYRMASLLAVGPTQGQTPLEFGNTLAPLLPDAREDVNFICDTFCRTRYGGEELSMREGFRIRLAWIRVRKAIVRHSLG